MNVLGQPIRRVEDPRFVSGRGRYVEDVLLPGMLHLAFVRSPYPKARITSIDSSVAQSMPGVVAVVTGEELGDVVGTIPSMRLPFAKSPPHPVLARGRVDSFGEPVVAVAAESAELARDAADAIQVEYEPQDSVVSAEAALAEGAPKVHAELDNNLCYMLKREGGQVDQAFDEADAVARFKVVNQRVAPIALEPRGVVAVPEDQADGLTVWISSQSPHGARADLAESLRFPENQIRVIAPDVGGGFGAKGVVYREYVLAAHLALKLLRPIKWIATRSEDVQTTTHGRDMVTEVEIAAKRDGTLTGLKLRNISNLGAHLYQATAIPAVFILNMGAGCYRVPNVRVETLAVFTNTPSTGPYRGAGRPEAVLAVESAIDEVARQIGMDPIEVRRKNFIRPDEFPYKTAVGATYDSGDYGKALDRALEVADYAGLVRQRDEARARGELVGIGVSCFVEPCGSPGFESGLVRIERTGRVTVATGAHSHGQGHETSFAQVAADRLHVPLDHIRVVHGDTSATPQGVGTFASRSLVYGGSAVFLSSEKVVEKGKRIAAHLLEATPDDIQLADGGFEVAGAPGKKVSWQQIAVAVYAMGNLPPSEEIGLEATTYYDPKAEMWPFGTHLAMVRIDGETGDVQVQKIVAVDDCGNVVNPLIVEGQVVGGIAQALGQCLWEEVAFDEAGQVLSGSLGDYAVPRAEDMPPVVVDHTTTPTPLNPLGAKGVGEAGTNGLPPAIVNAVRDALAPLGVGRIDTPFSAARVWEAIQSAHPA
jgi:aerobic carbon-monoxide dehydrogenase large subunit